MDGAAGTTVGTGIVPDGILLRGVSSTTIGAADPEVTGGNETGAALDAYPPNGSIESTVRGASAVAGGDGISVTRTSVDNIAGPAEDVVWGSFRQRARNLEQEVGGRL